MTKTNDDLTGLNAYESVKAYITTLDPQQKRHLDGLIAKELNKWWHATPGPQLEAMLSLADTLLYGGAAGGGKSDLLLGLALDYHTRSLIVRRQNIDLRGLEDRLFEILGTTDGYNSVKHRWKDPGGTGKILEFGGLLAPKSEQGYQGRPHDFVGFDEAAQLVESRVRFILGWLRSARPGQRCRAVLATNPPLGGEGIWLIDWFRPWLDELYPNPAKPGEIRWCIVVGDQTVWKEGPGVYTVNNENYTAESRTFIPAKLADNPYLRNTGYRAKIEAMDEPMRSQLLYGDFRLSRKDHKDQVIPSSYIRAARARWTAEGGRGKRQSASALDVAFGGTDKAMVARVYDAWFAPLEERAGIDVNHSADLVAMIMGGRKDKSGIGIDMTGGYGIGAAETIEDNDIPVVRINFSKKTGKKSAEGGLTYANLRAQMYWEFREDLAPNSEWQIALPPDTQLEAELAAPLKKTRAGNLYIESKEDLRKRLGRSTDRGDATVMAWFVKKRRLKQEMAEVRENNLHEHAKMEPAF